jgi:hypothetical protein
LAAGVTFVFIYFLDLLCWRGVTEGSGATGGGTKKNSAYVAGRGNVSLRRTDAVQVCSNVGMVPTDGPFECSVAIAARQIVSEKN